MKYANAIHPIKLTKAERERVVRLVVTAGTASLSPLLPSAVGSAVRPPRSRIEYRVLIAVN